MRSIQDCCVFEEPENGIHPFRIKAMTELLKDLSVDFNEIDIPLRQDSCKYSLTCFGR